MRRVRVLLVEDEASKRDRIAAEIQAFFCDALVLEVSETFGDASQKLLQRPYDLIIVDLMLPRRDGELPTDVSEEIVDNLMASELNRLATTVAISQFDDVIDTRRSHFVRAGILLIHYSEKDDWKSCLKVCMQRAATTTFYDFVIVCALKAERAGFSKINHNGFAIGELMCVAGLDVREMSIGELRGVCVLQPQMGLVDASVIAAKALEVFSPRLICMSGVCGGFVGKTALGAVIVSDFTWEHQAGKWRGDEFELRSYQESVEIGVRNVLSQLIEERKDLLSLPPGRNLKEVPEDATGLLPSVSGSAVIASDLYAAKIAKQHGKVAALDMEVFGVYRAAKLYAKPVAFFAAKTVVDLAGEAKNDDFHEEGAALSARFTVEAIARLLAP